MLRRAIEGDWPKPGNPTTKATVSTDLSGRMDSQESRHEAESYPAYLDWLRDEEAHCRQSCPDEYQRFEAKRTKERQDICRERSANVRAALLTAHDEERMRLLKFQQFLGLPDFWQWDANFNSQSFNPKS